VTWNLSGRVINPSFNTPLDPFLLSAFFQALPALLRPNINASRTRYGPLMAPPTPNLPPLSRILSETVKATTERAKEGHTLFGPIAALWDEYLQSDAVRKLPQRHRKPLELLCKEISELSLAHFDAYIKGIRPSPRSPSPTGSNAPPTPTATPPLAPIATTYASVTATPLTTPPLPATAPTKRTPVRKPTPQPRSDTRLFLRIGPDNIARETGPFAVLTALRNTLGTDAKLLREVQTVNSGYALCTGSIEARLALESKIPLLESLFTDCKIERQPDWVSYRLSNIPRTVTTLSDTGSLLSHLVSPAILAESIQFTADQSPVRSVETKLSSESSSFHTTWVVSFERVAHQPLPRTLRILGSAVHCAVIPPRTSVIQCTRCFHWHNARNCVRPLSCRVCGSRTHNESQHTTSCGSNLPHQCPARCLHCGGPHFADDLSCPLRPGKRPLSKSERSSILQTTKAARKRAYLAAGCSPTSATIPSTLPDPPLTLRPSTPPGTARNPEDAVTDQSTVRRTQYFDTAPIPNSLPTLQANRSQLFTNA